MLEKPTPVDVTGFENELGLMINPQTGEACYGVTHYDANGEPVTTYYATDLTFEEAWVTGFGVNQRFGRLALATEYTAEAMQKWLTKALLAKVDIVEAKWEGYVLVDKNHQRVPMRQLAIDYAGKVTIQSAGLTASNYIRVMSSPAAAVEMVRAQLV